jgi:hypothetical protein
MLTLTRQTRANFLSLMNGLSEEQLNHMPTGFNNNMIWNFVAMIYTYLKGFRSEFLSS